MDIVYIVGRGSAYNNIELRMSLRSICKYGKNIGTVAVIGAPPVWLSDEVGTLYVPDKYSYKHSNILTCIERAVDEGIVKGEFLYSSDDHFYVRNVDFDKYPYFYKDGGLPTAISQNDIHYQYHKSLYDTRLLLLKHNLPTKNYSQHCNTHMHADVIKDIRPIIHESYRMDFGAEPTSLIMNAWSVRKNAPVAVKRADLKVTKAASVKELYEKIGAKDCFSVGDSIFSSYALTDLFKYEYPEPCKYEKC